MWNNNNNNNLVQPVRKFRVSEETQETRAFLTFQTGFYLTQVFLGIKHSKVYTYWVTAKSQVKDLYEIGSERWRFERFCLVWWCAV